MASKAIIINGGTLERSRNGGTTWAKIPEVTSVALPSDSLDYVDVTSLDSEGGFREFAPGLIDPGETTAAANFTEDGYEQQLSDREWARTNGPLKYRFTFPVARGKTLPSVATYDAYPNPSVEGLEMGAKAVMNVNLRVTGKLTFVKGS